MSTIKITIDTDNLDEVAMHEIQAILRRVTAAAASERIGEIPLYPWEVYGERVEGMDGSVARFQLDKGKPKL